MYHISANWGFGRRKKNIWGTKSSSGRQKDFKFKRAPKKVAIFGNGSLFFIGGMGAWIYWGDGPNSEGGGGGGIQESPPSPEICTPESNVLGGHLN